MLKILGIICIVVAGAMIGMYYSQIQLIRKKELNCIKKALLLLKSQIEYSSEALPEALHNISLRSEEPIKSIFDKIYKELVMKKGNSISQVWTRHFNLYANNMKLSKEDLEAIISFGRVLGYLDKGQQINNIQIAVEYIDQTVECINKKNEKDGKMYRSLGVLGGMLLAVLLL